MGGIAEGLDLNDTGAVVPQFRPTSRLHPTQPNRHEEPANYSRENTDLREYKIKATLPRFPSE